MNEVAPEGQVWVCVACGKRSRDRYGMQPIDKWWDESCMMNAILCYEDKLVITNGRACEVLEGGVAKNDIPEVEIIK